MSEETAYRMCNTRLQLTASRRSGPSCCLPVLPHSRPSLSMDSLRSPVRPPPPPPPPPHWTMRRRVLRIGFASRKIGQVMAVGIGGYREERELVTFPATFHPFYLHPYATAAPLCLVDAQNVVAHPYTSAAA
jgi:hypothetical protein